MVVFPSQYFFFNQANKPKDKCLVEKSCSNWKSHLDSFVKMGSSSIWPASQISELSYVILVEGSIASPGIN